MLKGLSNKQAKNFMRYNERSKSQILGVILQEAVLQTIRLKSAAKPPLVQARTVFPARCVITGSSLYSLPREHKEKPYSQGRLQCADEGPTAAKTFSFLKRNTRIKELQAKKILKQTLHSAIKLSERLASLNMKKEVRPKRHSSLKRKLPVSRPPVTSQRKVRPTNLVEEEASERKSCSGWQFR